MDECEVRAALKDIDLLSTYEERASERLKLCERMLNGGKDDGY